MGGPRLIAERASMRDNHFNLIRAIAATGVLVSHSWPLTLGPGSEEPMEAWIGVSLGRISVLVFFTISGFFIAQSYDRSRSWSVFLAARALRLFPALVVVLLITVLALGPLLTTADPAEYWPEAIRYFLDNVTLRASVHALPGVFEDTPSVAIINGSLWILLYEVICNIGILADGLLGLFSRPRLFTLAFVLAMALPLGGRVLRLSELGLSFALGTALYIWRDGIPLSPALAVGYAVLLAGFWPAPRLLGFNRLGDYSYGIYIYAFPIQQCAAMVGVDTPWSMVAVALPVTLGLAAISWHLVERPALRLKPSAPSRRIATAGQTR